MLSYIVRRLLLALPALLGITFLTYAFLGATGDPCAALLGERYTAERCEVVRQRYRLDDPLPVKYGRYLGAVLSGDLGTSVVSKRPVAQELLDHLLPVVPRTKQYPLGLHAVGAVGFDG